MAASDWLGVDEEKDQEQELLNRAVEVMLQLSQKFEARLWEHKTKMSTLRERERKLRMRGAMVRLLQKKGGWAEDSQTPVLTKASLWLLPHGEHLNVGSTGGSAGSWPCAVGRVSPDDRADDADDEYSDSEVDDDWHEEGQRLEPGKVDGQHLNVGSTGHHLRICKPCTLWNTNACKDGKDCKFCHLCKPGEKKQRK
ncbi:C3H1-type domain-containing protein [Durusdinium trenchii]|uniref:C3H1-type domain-containing protein n=1 Tax=Durusdinium trenchii TaxID=1381693 RepID=A0ABP0PKZ6_9DINO